jgi:hypothetical protein
MQRHRVTAGHVTVETAVPGGRAHVDVFRGELVPLDVPQEQVDTELRLGTIEPVEVDDEPSSSDVDEEKLVEPPAIQVPEGMSVATTLEWVGDDLDKARAALAAEEIKGEFGRATLVDRLTKLIAAAEAVEREGAGSGENPDAGPSLDS